MKDKSIILNKKRAVFNQVKTWLNQNGIPFTYKTKKKYLLSLFCEMNNILIPSNVSVENHLLSLYENNDYNILGAKTSRPEIKHSVWVHLTKQVFSKYGKVCLCCGSTSNIAIDHIKPYSKYPELAIDINNLQPLCRSCNSKKSNKKIIDYR
jgi:5-methylcytosine-specific restriction endonuclease McrA